MSSETINALARAVQKAQNHNFFLGNILSEFQRLNNLDEKKLAASLGCDIQNLPLLALCRCPLTSQTTFASDVDHLTYRFGLHANQLANIIREVEALQALRGQLMSNSVAPGLLLAARDRENSAITDEGDNE